MAHAAAAIRDLTLTVTLLTPGILTVFLAFNSGGFFPGTVALAATELAVLTAVGVLLAKRPFEGVTWGVLAACGGLAALAAWTLISTHWSHAESRAIPVYDRILVYALALFAVGSIARSAARMRTLVYGMAAAIVGICVCSLITMLLPDVWPATPSRDPTRLSFPITYWNSLGMLAGIGILFCGHLAVSLRDNAIVRAVGAGAVPLLVAVLYYTASRGALWATAVGVAIYAILAHPRGLLAGAIAMLPATVVTLITVNPSSQITAAPNHAEAIARGERTAWVIGGCALAAALLRLALIPLDRAIGRISITRRTKRAIAVGAATVCVAVVAASLTLGHGSQIINEKVAQFNTGGVGGAGGSARFFSASANGRISHWNVALDSYRSDPLHGTGAGTYATQWAQLRASTIKVENAHSLYLEVLGELGWPGLVALLVGLLTLLGGFAFRARGQERAMYAALLAAGIAWALHGAVDWDWQTPAVSLWLFAAGGLALARPRQPSKRRMRRRWLRLPVLLTCVGLGIIPVKILLSENHLTVAKAAYDAGDCRAAQAAASASLASMSSRPQPHQVIAGCAIRFGRNRVAVRELRSAIATDPRNWQLWYDLAVARAAAGKNPRSAARTALRLNPREPLTQTAATKFSTGTPRAWRKRAATTTVVMP